MARTDINYAEPTEADLAYLAQRPWLVTDAALQGHKTLKETVAAYARGEQATAAEQEIEVISYAEGKMDELRAELERRGLDTTGKKAELVLRLEEDDLAAEKDAAGEEEIPEED